MKCARGMLLGLVLFFLSTGNSFGDTIHLQPTDRVPSASGEVSVEHNGATMRLEVKADGMKPATLFGGDYNTYIVWAISNDGAAENIGELLLDGDEGRLRSSITSNAFTVIVTAEPHYLVSVPSSFVVLEEKSERRTPRYRTVRGMYYFERETLDDVKDAKGEVQTGVKQAFTAVRLAQRAGASTLAREAFAEAQRSLDETLSLSRERKDPHEIDAQARETIHLAVAAQNLAEGRAISAAVDTAGKAREGEAARLKSAARGARK